MKCKNKSFINKSTRTHRRYLFLKFSNAKASIEEPTKGQVSLNPKASPNNHNGKSDSLVSIFIRRRAIQTS
jgi:hypothetical protein